MATKKQRARRAKTFRHEYGFVGTDEEGNEVELTGSDVRSKKPSSGSSAKTASKGGSGGARRGARDPQPPSWNRALKRGLPWGAVAGLVVTLVLRGSPIVAVLYAVLFVPITYWSDGLVYRRWQKRQAGGPPARHGKGR